uniref:Uncharacterized protein n=1 Tax=Ascaris lumbricoides TaxID=6252 RepID=A0A0M3IEN8_ASCLU
MRKLMRRIKIHRMKHTGILTTRTVNCHRQRYYSRGVDDTIGAKKFNDIPTACRQVLASRKL